MARIQQAQAIYNVVDKFRDTCIKQGLSLLWPDKKVWTPENIITLIKAFVDIQGPDQGNFLNRLKSQLESCSEEIHRLAVDILAFYYLYPSNITKDNKIKNIKTVISWKFADQLNVFTTLDKAYATSIGSPGVPYVIQRPSMLIYFLSFFHQVLTTDSNIDDISTCKKLADEIVGQVQYSKVARHILLYLLFPDNFERISSDTHRTNILQVYKDLSGGATDTDDALANIRSALIKQLDRSNLDFYQEDIRAHWLPNINWWIEKTIVQGRQDRQRGEYKLGSALWSPQKAKNGADKYRSMREVKPADVILHLTDNTAFTGISLVQSAFDDKFVGLEDTDWANIPGYLVKLSEFTKLEPILPRSIIFQSPYKERLIRLINSGTKNLFYNQNLELNQGSYLTPAPPELVKILDDAYESIAGHTLSEFVPEHDKEEPVTKPSVSEQNNVMESSQVSYLPPKSPATQRYWLFAPGKNAEYWDEFFSKGIMAIGWDYLGDLGHQYETRKSIAKRLREYTKNPDAKETNNAMCCYSFAHTMNIGDIVFAKKGRGRIVGWGVVSSDYYFDDARANYKHVRTIDWKARGEWTVSEDQRFAMKTLTDITKYTDFVTYLNGLIRPTSSKIKQYWWLNANPKIWNFVDSPVGALQTYTAINEQGNKRRIHKYFQEVNPDDIIIGYISSPNKEIVAEAVITKGLHQSTQEGEIIEFRKTESFLNPISYEKLKQLPELQDAEPLGNHQGSLFKLTADQYDIIRSLINEANPPPSVKPVIPIVYTKKQALSELFMDSDSLDKAIGLLVSKKNIVLQGPPGVGKTFFAKRLAYTTLGMKDDTKIQMIQFHQSYSYEDFIQGYRPNKEGQFDLKSGIFYTFCRQAQLDEKNKYFFIIDEINRGNLSKIFGELMMLIEYDKRGREYAIPCMYAQGPDDKFYIPENLFLIGTMNTADRSLAMVDYALRRRFCFIDLEPAFDKPSYQQYLTEAGAKDSFIREIVIKMAELNIKIENDKNLGKGFKIGHSYFCPQLGIVPDRNWFKDIIVSEIEQLLKEYWFDNQSETENAIKKLLL